MRGSGVGVDPKGRRGQVVPDGHARQPVHRRPADRPGSVGRVGRLGILSIVAVCVGLTASCSGSTADRVGSALGLSSTSPAAAAAGGSGTALSLLGTLPVRAEDNSPKYRRDAFGTPWSDVDHNGCDTRNDILRRDMRSTTLRKADNCTVLTGELTDPYTTRIIRFNRARSASAVQIDHVVALADAWRTGALEWTDAQRLQFANDPQNLLAVDGPTNIRKSDQDAAEWLPPSPGEQCPYVARQVGLKSRYHLWVTSAETAAMRTVLQKCSTQSPLGL
ncbi:HNH endonuclease family protein, partial [Candidatus Frankia nodulisporulans]|uniref:HNH endonuclease family protein n=2 Tax=Candidatus Frankia nodulisporulans TaxID=2060052 RepID=UPI003B82D72E